MGPTPFSSTNQHLIENKKIKKERKEKYLKTQKYLWPRAKREEVPCLTRKVIREHSGS